MSADELNGPRIFGLYRSDSELPAPEMVTQLADSFAASIPEKRGPVVPELEGAEIVAVRGNGQVKNFLLVSEHNRQPESVIKSFAAMVEARTAVTELPEHLGDAGAVGYFSFDKSSTAMRETQANIDPSAVPKMLNVAMADGSWVAASMRRPMRLESKRWKPWLGSRLDSAQPTHHSNGKKAVVSSIYVGANDPQEVRALLGAVHGALPGFDLGVKYKIADKRRTAMATFIPGLFLAFLGLFGATAIGTVVATITRSAETGLSAAAGATWLLAPGAALVAAGVLTFLGIFPSREMVIRKSMNAGKILPVRIRATSPRKPRQGKSVQRGEESIQLQPSDGDYPLSKSSFLIGVHLLAGLGSPNAGVASGERTTRERLAPAALFNRVGPMIGLNQGRDCHLSGDDIRLGVAIFGQAGSGKSNFVRGLYAWHCLERLAPTGREGWPGEMNAMIAFESKGDGAAEYQAWANSLGDNAVLVSLTDANTPTIDMFSIPGTISQRAQFLTSAMQYAFKDGAVQYQSLDTLKQVLTAALAIDDAIAGQVQGLALGESPMYYASVLLGNFGDPMGVLLHAAIKTQRSAVEKRGAPDENLVLAVEALASLYDGVTAAQRRGVLSAPRNKINRLVGLGSWWSPSRPRVTWEQILEKNRSIIINTGPSENSTVLMDDELTQEMSSMLLFTLRAAIMRTRSNGLASGRYVTLFSDELSLLSGSSTDVVVWFRDQGRAFGIRTIFATQRPEKLEEDLRKAMLTFPTFASFSQSDTDTAKTTAVELSGGVEDFEGDDILYLPRYTAAIRTTVNGNRQSVFTVAVADFETDRSLFPASQGWTAGSDAATTSASGHSITGGGQPQATIAERRRAVRGLPESGL